MPTVFLDQPTPLAFAHRGGASHFPENSWRAFEHAVKLDYAYLETDAHATADGVLVAFHDKSLDRVTDRKGAIASLPFREVAAARIDGTDPIPRLEELLGAWPDVRFNIDVKEMPAARPLAEVLRRTAAWDRVCITSFSAARLRATRRLLDRPVCMAASPVGAAGLRSGLPGTSLAPAFASRWVRCAQLPIGMATAPLVGRAHRAGLQVHVWTVNDRKLMTSLLDLGVDGIMTDQTELLRDLLIERGQWHPRSAS
ncbi:MAG TPA: glycerophosphodiester phosphodiesterase family protein [Streptosporangiaceae bacterium]|nr:glycerophosphodiester phosphodiesterase family protein [Streptosporangiaceae bacterium]